MCDFTTTNILKKNIITWQQENTNDCGIFTIINVREFIIYIGKKQPKDLGIEQLDKFPDYFHLKAYHYDVLRIIELRYSFLVLFTNLCNETFKLKKGILSSEYC